MTTFLSQVERLQAPEIDYGAVAPLLIVLGAACLSVLVEAFLPKAQRWASQVVLLLLTLAAAGVSLVLYGLAEDTPEQGVTTFSGHVSVDQPVVFLWGTLLMLGLASVLLIADRSVEPGGAFVPEGSAGGPAGGPGGGGVQVTGRAAVAVMTREQASRFGMQTEVFPLTLFALGGMMVFVAANDLLTMFIALEVLSLPLYLMCGLARRRRLLSQEAAVKYFLLGAFASAFFLYGVALLYGYAGSVKLADIASATTATDRSDTLLYAGFGLLVVGLLFKGSVGPFHAWTPDVYQGAPTPVTAFMAACTKVAAFGGILRVLYGAFEGSSWEWEGVLWGVAIISMFVGAIIGLTQTDVKRMIAYSSVAHAGFLLVGVIALNPEGLSGTMFYLLAYGFTTVAVFGVISLVRNADGEATHLSQWAGLAKRSPVLAAVFTFLLLALAGLPMTSGFVGKFVVFAAAVEAGMTPLVVIALVASAIAAFFYLRVIVLMYFSEPAADGPAVSVPGAFTTMSITLGTAVTLALGVFPTPALEWAGAGAFIF
ncbi:NADH-quinone oxidoreductase subunit NuoN [Saccharothrix longispora]|nr:NADH-quinone oxidoreductase subunit NuoN [Saccharothrix longispora]MDU0289497.1 NADH-quinone oxidoreductase subunit NuoN [Saccharothrix longispora]